MPNAIHRLRMSGSGYPNIAVQLVAASSQFASIADNANVSMGAGVRTTVAAWFMIDTTGVIKTIIGKGLPGGGAANVEYAFVVSSGNQLQFIVSDNTTKVTASASTFGSLSAGIWYFGAGRYDGTNASVSVNAGTVDTAAFSTDIVDGANQFIIGADAGGGSRWNGRLDCVGLWKVALTDAQVTTLYNSSIGMAYKDVVANNLATSLVDYWDLDGTFKGAKNVVNLTGAGGPTFTAGKR